MDAFYASVEQLDHPELRGRPVVVGGNGRRGVVAACSYESRRFGVHSAMPMAEALRRCPEAVVVPVRMARYAEMSRTVMGVFESFTPAIQQISIDEAFLDMTGTERLLGAAPVAARALKDRVREVTRLTISVGIGSSRFIAKLASKVDKPDGLFMVAPGGEEAFVLGRGLADLWGVGASTRRRLERLGVTTVAHLRDCRIEWLRGHFGDSGGRYLYDVSRGIDPGIYSGHGGRHSISAEETYEHDLTSGVEIRRRVVALADEVIHRSIAEGWRGRTVQVKLRFPPFETHTVSRTLTAPPESSNELTAIASRLLEERRGGRPLRLIGVGLAGDREEPASAQGDLFATATPSASLDPVVVALRERFGPGAIGRAGSLDERHHRPR